MTMYSALALAASICVTASGAAQAGVSKTWVASTGTDTGTCPFATPCATLQYAHDQTNAGGEIDIKDSGGYGTLTITKSISLLAADGILATVNVPANGTGITVNAGSGATVLIQGLSIDGHKLAYNYGIVSNIVTSLIVQHCALRNTYTGLVLNAGTSVIRDSMIAGNTIGLDGRSTTTYLGHNLIAANTHGVQGGFLYSFGDNDLRGNDFDADNAITAVAKR